MNHLVYADWLLEQDLAPSTSPGDPSAMQAPTTDPNIADPNQNPNQPDDPMGDMGGQDPQQEPEDISQDPQAPDMPEPKDEHDDFETWKNTYFKESIGGDTNKLVDLLNGVRDKEGLHSYQKKFIEDNWNIQLVRQNANVEKASKDIRRATKDQLDRNNPATSLTNNVHSVLESMPMLNNIFIKLSGYGGLKGDLHRKYIGALLGAVQVGSGGNSEDLIYNEREYSVEVSTRFNSKWGDVVIGTWSLREDDPERYLSEPERKRLQEGSPEERDVLKRRVIMESISKQFEQRAFYINVVSEDGAIITLGWDLASCLRSAYAEGKLIVKTKNSDNSEAMIDENGQIIPLVDLKIYYAKESGQQTDDGKPEIHHIEFMEKREGTLFLTATSKTIKESSSGLQGMAFKETPYAGNPSDLKVLSRCVYSAHDLLMRQC